MSVRLRTTKKVSWGGWNPFINNYLEFELNQKSKTQHDVTFLIKDIVKSERIIELENNQTQNVEYDYTVLREKVFTVDITLYNQLYQVAEQQLPSGLTPFEKETMREKIAFLIYFTNDFLQDENGNDRVDENGNKLCLYGLLSNEVEII